MVLHHYEYSLFNINVKKYGRLTYLNSFDVNESNI